ncbi:MAG: hypothetical protein P8X81_00425 [Woeseiaceae bacterium]|jgi:hypothetical protein
MKRISARLVAFAVALFAAVSVALLWSWNALAELTGGPAAEYRHVLAAIIIAFAARSLFTSRRRRHHQHVS